jgi:hypothetical protein
MTMAPIANVSSKVTRANVTTYVTTTLSEMMMMTMTMMMERVKVERLPRQGGSTAKSGGKGSGKGDNMTDVTCGDDDDDDDDEWVMINYP